MATIRNLAALVATRVTDDARYSLYKGEVPKTPPGPYVTFYPGSGFTYSDNLGAGNNRQRHTCRFVCSGFAYNDALATADLIRARMLGWQPYPDTPSAGRFLEVDEDAPLIRDDTVPSDIRFSLTLTYRLYTNRS